VEAGGAFFGGLRYGEGVLYTKNVRDLKVFWQGPKVGWDFGGEGARTMMRSIACPRPRLSTSDLLALADRPTLLGDDCIDSKRHCPGAHSIW
jgi:Envelope integrity protein A